MADESSHPSSSQTSGAHEKHLQIVPPVGLDNTVQNAKKRTAKKGDTWRVWTGTIGDVRKINQRFEELVAARRDELLRTATDEYDRRQLHRGFRPEAIIATRSDEMVSGRFDDVVDELNPQTWTTVTLRAGNSLADEYLCVEFRRKPGAVELTVKSADPGMAVASLTRLSELIELGKPRWAWVHSMWGAMLIGGSSAMIVSGTVGAIIYARWAYPLGSLGYLIVTGIQFIAACLIAWCSVPLTKRLLPPAEIRYDSVPQSSGSKLIGSFIGLLLIPIVLSLVFALVL
jgi:hypothetical protein